eukprot:scaffold177516_cov26-Tisochrysis_lutea.AAC.1
MGAALSSWLDAAGGPAASVPGFMTMDGAFVASAPSPLARSFGWLRLEGHGTLLLKPSEVHQLEFHGEWEVLDERTARLKLRLPDDLPDHMRPPCTSLLLLEGDANGTVILRCEGEDGERPDGSCQMEFVPEEHEEGH